MLSVATDPARLPAEAVRDIAYVKAAFVPLAREAVPLVEAEVLPRPSYVLPDGTPMVPRDHAALVEEAGHPANVMAHFTERFVAAGGDPADAEAEHQAWLSGLYGVCLRSARPELIVAKGALIASISALLARPEPDEESWLRALRGAVDALDAIERPFAAYDRTRLHSLTSRDRFVSAPRRRFPQAWST